MKTPRKRRNPHLGESFDSFLKAEGLYESVTTAAIKRTLTKPLGKTLKQQRPTKAKTTRRMTEKQLIARDSKRDIGAELLQAAREMKAGKAARVHHVKVPEIVEARIRTGLSRQEFATVLGISPRTLKSWEQGHRTPTGAARSLMSVARRHPEVLRELFSK